jgi:aminoglycoside phosphotransferase (APT) family kinase protein
MQQRIRQFLLTHAPELAGAEVRELGHGLDHTAFLAGDLVIRVGNEDTAEREARLLAAVADAVAVPVPRVRFADAGILAYPLLPGRPLLGRPAPGGLAELLGQFLRRLHALDVDFVPHEPADPGEWLDDLDGPPSLVRVLHATVPAPAARSVLVHADLGAEHLLESGGVLTGVIDWTDAAVTDPALDFARLYRDFGPDFLTLVGQAYGDPPPHDRILFFARCAALEDLAYGGAHAEAAARSLAWLF